MKNLHSKYETCCLQTLSKKQISSVTLYSRACKSLLNPFSTNFNVASGIHKVFYSSVGLPLSLPQFLIYYMGKITFSNLTEMLLLQYIKG